MIRSRGEENDDYDDYDPLPRGSIMRSKGGVRRSPATMSATLKDEEKKFHFPKAHFFHISYLIDIHHHHHRDHDYLCMPRYILLLHTRRHQEAAAIKQGAKE